MSDQTRYEQILKDLNLDRDQDLKMSVRDILDLLKFKRVYNMFFHKCGGLSISTCGPNHHQKNKMVN